MSEERHHDMAIVSRMKARILDLIDRCDCQRKTETANNRLIQSLHDEISRLTEKVRGQKTTLEDRAEKIRALQAALDQAVSVEPG